MCINAGGDAAKQYFRPLPQLNDDTLYNRGHPLKQSAPAEGVLVIQLGGTLPRLGFQDILDMVSMTSLTWALGW